MVNPGVTTNSPRLIDTTTQDPWNEGHPETTAAVNVTFAVEGPHPENLTGNVTLRGERGDYVANGTHTQGGDPIYSWRASEKGASLRLISIDFIDSKASDKYQKGGGLTLGGYSNLVLPLTADARIDLDNNATTRIVNGFQPASLTKDETTRSALSKEIGEAWVYARSRNPDLQLGMANPQLEELLAKAGELVLQR